MKKRKQHPSGMTLIEIVVVLAILAVVLTAVFSFMNFGNRVFAKTTRQSELQQEVRLAADVLISKLRYATSVEVRNSYDAQNVYDYLMLSADGKSIEYVQGALAAVNVIQVDDPGFSLDLLFTTDESPVVSGKVIKFSNRLANTNTVKHIDMVITATSSMDAKNFTVSTDLDLMNLTSFLPSVDFLQSPVASPESGVIPFGTTISLTGPTGASIYYTHDAALPLNASSGTLYSGPISMGSYTLLRVISVKDGIQSPEVQYTYTSKPAVSDLHIKDVDETSAPKYKKGESIMVFYTYGGVNAQSGSTISFYRSSSKSGATLPVGATLIVSKVYDVANKATRSYIMTADDVGKYIYVGVTPKDTADTTGEPVYYSDENKVGN